VLLDGAGLKLAWADQRIRDLKALTEPVADAATKSIVREDDGDPTKLVYRVTEVPALPAAVPLLIGDIVHAIRSAFDHLAYQLVLADGKTPIDSSYFPMHGDRLNKKGNPRTITIAPGIKRQDILDALERVQPYHGADPWDDQLYAINQLDIIDKHRVLLAAVTRLNIQNPAWWGLTEGVPSPLWWFNTEPLKSGDPVARFDFRGTPAPDYFDPHITLAVTLDEGPPGHWLRHDPVATMLGGIRHILTWQIINWHFVPLFPGEPDLQVT
jgi:hypothetical protein